MAREFLRIRITQCWRELKALGWWRATVAGVGVLGGLTAFSAWTRHFPTSLYAFGGLLLCVAAIHFWRQDKDFMRVSQGSLFPVCLVEYLIFTAPFLLLVLLSPSWYLAPVAPVFYAILCRVSFSSRGKIRLIGALPFVAADNFEWKSGIRLNFWQILVFYAACLGFVRFPYVSLYLWWVLLVLIIPFYQEYEALDMLERWELAPAAFLHKKLTSQLKYYLLFSAPIFGAYILLHAGDIWIALAVWVLSAINLSWFILSKYASYQPARKMQGGNLVVTLVHLAMLIPMAGPFMIPVPLVLGLRAYRKSLHRLKPYLDAYD